VRKIKLALAGLLIALSGLAVTPSHADGICYNLRILHKGNVIINQWVPWRC
jgi:hypothetical protein